MDLGIGALRSVARRCPLFDKLGFWIPAARSFAAGFFIYSRSGAHFSWALLCGLPEVRSGHRDERLITTGIECAIPCISVIYAKCWRGASARAC